MNISEQQSLLSKIKNALVERLGSRLKGVVLFGSETRHTAENDSDIDILILLENPISLSADLDTIIDATYSIQLFLNRGLHFSIADHNTYMQGEYSLYRAIQKTGIAA